MLTISHVQQPQESAVKHRQSSFNAAFKLLLACAKAAARTPRAVIGGLRDAHRVLWEDGDFATGGVIDRAARYMRFRFVIDMNTLNR